LVGFKVRGGVGGVGLGSNVAVGRKRLGEVKRKLSDGPNCHP